MKTNKHKLLSRMDCTFISTYMKRNKWIKKEGEYTVILNQKKRRKTLIYVYRNSDSKWICVPLHHKKI